MGEKITKNGDEAPEDIIMAIAEAEMWVVFTAQAYDKGIKISLRQSSKQATVNMIAVLLEQEDIYKDVTAKMAEVKEEKMKEGKDSPNLNVN